LHFALSTRRAFTLIELMVVVGLMAILLTMIGTVFYQSSQAFRSARATIEIHESARAAMNAMVDDLTATEFSAYDTGVQGYFALTPCFDPDPNAPAPLAANMNWRGAWSGTASYLPNDVVTYGGTTYLCIAGNLNQPTSNTAYWNIVPRADTLTFTTLAAQPSARYAATSEAVEQLALVRYSLEWDGGSAVLPGSRGPRPTYNLVKRVRFPNASNPNLNMDAFPLNPNLNPYPPPANLPNNNTGNYTGTGYASPTAQFIAINPSLQPEVDPTDPNAMQYAQSEPIAFHVLSMNVRLFCLPAKQAAETSEAFVYAGTATASSPAGNNTLIDGNNTWTGFLADTDASLRIMAGTGAGQPPLVITSVSGNTLTLSIGWTTGIDNTSQYRVDGTLASSLLPTWSSGAAYSMGSLVTYNGIGYTSLQNSNTSHEPDTSGTYWALSPSPPTWYQRSSYGSNFFGPTYRPPAIVEITLELTDVRATHSFIFTQRFYIPASER
jgi:prepilin-type N-terminal cleavage/methylation domain-containing protein